jgi:hypothetical protein
MEIVWKYYGSSDAIANSIVRISPSVFSSVSYIDQERLGIWDYNKLIYTEYLIPYYAQNVELIISNIYLTAEGTQ